MSFRTWADAKVKTMSWLDLKFAQLSAVFFFLIIAKLWEPLLSLEWYWYVVIAVLFAIKPAYKALRK